MQYKWALGRLAAILLLTIISFSLWWFAQVSREHIYGLLRGSIMISLFPLFFHILKSSVIYIENKQYSWEMD